MTRGGERKELPPSVITCRNARSVVFIFVQDLSTRITHERNTNTGKLACWAASVPALQVGRSSAATRNRNARRQGSTAAHGDLHVQKRRAARQIRRNNLKKMPPVRPRTPCHLHLLFQKAAWATPQNCDPFSRHSFAEQTFRLSQRG